MASAIYAHNTCKGYVGHRYPCPHHRHGLAAHANMRFLVRVAVLMGLRRVPYAASQSYVVQTYPLGWLPLHAHLIYPRWQLHSRYGVDSRLGADCADWA